MHSRLTWCRFWPFQALNPLNIKELRLVHFFPFMEMCKHVANTALQNIRSLAHYKYGTAQIHCQQCIETSVPFLL